MLLCLCDFLVDHAMNVAELRLFRDQIMQTAQDCGVLSVKIFGSTVRGDATEDSDVDFLISIKKDASLLDVGRFKWKTEELLNKRVDIAFENKLHGSISEHVLREAQPL